MKKYKLYTLTLITCLCLSFVGCGSDKDIVYETAENVLQSAMACDVATVSSYCHENVLTDIGLNAISPEYAETMIYENMGIEKVNLSEKSQQAVSDFCIYYSDKIIQDYTLGEVTLEDTMATVIATVTTHSFDSLSSDTFQADLDAMMENYQEEHMDELISINLNEGNEAMMNKVFDDLMPDIMAAMKKSYDSSTPENVNIEFTFEKTNDTWLITKAALVQ